MGPPADLGASRNVWLACLIALVALLVVVNLASDATLDLKYGWDIDVNCAAVDAYVGGLDPYYARNLKGTTFSYPYLPVTLDLFRPLCAGGFLVGHYRGIFHVLAVLCGLLLPGLDRRRRGPRDIALRVLCALGAFVGFEWVAASGNFAILSGLLTAVALALLLGSGAHDDRGFTKRLAGSGLLGLVMSFKLVFCPVLAALYFLPLPRREKLILLAVSAIGFALPFLISIVVHPDLFPSWLLAIKGQIPNQHSVYLERPSPSLLLVAQHAVDRLGLADNKPVAFAAYGLATVALVLAPFAFVVLRMIAKAQPCAGGSWLTRLDRWLIEHPSAAMRISVLAMYGLYLCAPRLREYAFFELALYAAILIVDLPAATLAAVLMIGIAFPTMAAITGNPFADSFGQLAVALVCFWILLWDFLRRHLARPVGGG